MKIKFEWDDVKATSNKRKHGISFELAVRVFADPSALVEQDRIENGEYRWQTLGRVDDYLVLMVAHTITDDDTGNEVIRIISARKAAPKERKRYVKNCSLYH